MGVLFWLALTLILLVIEALTLGLVTIWFACGAFAAAITAMIIGTGHVAAELIVFVIFSGLTIVLIRPFFKGRLKTGSSKTNIDELIGKKVKVITKIDNFNGTGQVMVNGIEWTALSADDNKVIDENAAVVIKEIRGVKLIVEKYEEEL